MSTHDLKTWPGPYAAVLTGRKPYEVRIDDRGFAVGDVLHLHRFDPFIQRCTGEQVVALVTHITRLSDWIPGCDPRGVVLGIGSVTELDALERTPYPEVTR